MNIYEADHSIIITTSDFTSSAKDFATSFSNKIELWNYETIISKLKDAYQNN
jgi:HJR/Mrr/RecB family endonuclease